MREFGALEARTHFGTMLKLVMGGEQAVIVRRGRPVARLVPVPGYVNPKIARQAVADLIALRKGVTLGAELSIEDLLHERGA